MLENDITEEREYQKWCNDHIRIFGDARVVNDSVRSISISDQVDLLIKDIATGFSDLIELKRPNMDVLRYDQGHRNYYFSNDASKAIGQCHRYLDVLHEAAAKGLQDHPEIVAYHPHATIVIGRSNDWEQSQTKALHGLNKRLNGISIITYDHLLSRNEDLLSLLSPHQNDRSTDNHDVSAVDIDEEIPF